MLSFVLQKLRAELPTLVASVILLTPYAGTKAAAQTADEDSFSFVATADIREFTAPAHAGERYFEGVCKAIQEVGAGSFMISPGDIDPPAAIQSTISTCFGSNYIWYPVVGNHEAETPADMKWLREWGTQPIPGLVRRGPAGCETTTFSFDHGCAHFVVLNQYFNGKSDTGAKGDVVEELYEWLRADLEATSKKVVFVIGHEPIKPLPDMDNGRLRHTNDSLNLYADNCKRFQDLLVKHKVTAYLCAHTHNTSLAKLQGLWQVDNGHARGKGDRGAPSTFLKFLVTSKLTTVEVYRQLTKDGPYTLTRTVPLD